MRDRRTKLRLLQSLGATTRQPMPSHPLRMTHGATASRPLRVRSPTTSTQRRRSNNTTTSSCSRSSRIISSRHSSSHSSRRPRCRHRRASTVRRMPPRRRPPTHRPLHPHSSRCASLALLSASLHPSPSRAPPQHRVCIASWHPDIMENCIVGSFAGTHWRQKRAKSNACCHLVHRLSSVL